MRRIKLVLLISILFVLICICTNVYAGVTVSQSSVSINEGESKTITLSASNATGTVNVSSSNTSVAIASADNWIDDGKSINITITGKSAGSATITVSGIVSDNSGKDIDYSLPISVSVKAKEQTPTTPSTSGGTSTTPSTPTVTKKSNNANVTMIKTSPVDFSGFKANKTSGYEVAVENDVDKIYVSITKEDSKASVSLLNKTNSDTGKSWVYIAEGNNEIDVTVTAEDGKTTKKYTINVTRKESIEKQDESEENPEVTQEEQPMEEVFGLSELKIEGIELEPQFQTDVYEYKINLTEELDKLAITTLATEANSNIEILGNENLLEGENIITIHVKNENGEKNATYQITVNKTTQKVENVISETQNIEELPSQTQNNKKKIIVVSVAVLVIILIIIVAIVIKSRKNKNLDEDDFVTFEDFPNSEEPEEINAYDDVYEEVKKRKKSKGKRFK